MKKKLIVATTAATAVALLGGIGVAAPAQADPGSQGYVTKSEFKKVQRGMSITKAHKIFGTSGKQSVYDAGYPGFVKASQLRQYKTGKKYGVVMVTYQRVNGVWKVQSKNAFWG
jgi:IMP dehydrogenase/GMP reductase